MLTYILCGGLCDDQGASAWLPGDPVVVDLPVELLPILLPPVPDNTIHYVSTTQNPNPTPPPPPSILPVNILSRRLFTHSGAGSPSASHSITKGLSFWSCRTLTWGAGFIETTSVDMRRSGRRGTWKRSSSVGGCFIMCGGLWTGKQGNIR